jgi:hypothetical protein
MDLKAEREIKEIIKRSNSGKKSTPKSRKRISEKFCLMNITKETFTNPDRIGSDIAFPVHGIGGLSEFHGDERCKFCGSDTRKDGFLWFGEDKCINDECIIHVLAEHESEYLIAYT